MTAKNDALTQDWVALSAPMQGALLHARHNKVHYGRARVHYLSLNRSTLLALRRRGLLEWEVGWVHANLTEKGAEIVKGRS